MNLTCAGRPYLPRQTVTFCSNAHAGPIWSPRESGSPPNRRVPCGVLDHANLGGCRGVQKLSVNDLGVDVFIVSEVGIRALGAEQIPSFKPQLAQNFCR